MTPHNYFSLSACCPSQNREKTMIEPEEEQLRPHIPPPQPSCSRWCCRALLWLCVIAIPTSFATMVTLSMYTFPEPCSYVVDTTKKTLLIYGGYQGRIHSRSVFINMEKVTYIALTTGNYLSFNKDLEIYCTNSNELMLNLTTVVLF